MAQKKISLLIAEDDANLSFLLKSNLEEEGYSVVCCPDGKSGWETYCQSVFDLCILDIMLPKKDGFTLAKMIRETNVLVPILFLSARTLKEDICMGFEIGADDYITKPFSIKELTLRIKAVLKRTVNDRKPGNSKFFSIGNMHFDYNARQLQVGTEIRKLSTKENELLRMLCESKNIVLNRNRLLIEVWGNDDFFVSKSLDVYITRLRKLLKNANVSLQNYHSIGYKLVENSNFFPNDVSED